MKKSPCLVASLLACSCLKVSAADGPFDGLNLGLGNLYRASSAQMRSISREDLTGEKGRAGMSTIGPARGAAREVGQGWKVSPFVHTDAHATWTLAEISGAGAIQQIWMPPSPLDKTRGSYCGCIGTRNCPVGTNWNCME
ncbi:MAG: hypothetical protein ABSG78_14780 [Verrucomicrobiota bacterium]|jgi:hypothetical protein